MGDWQRQKLDQLKAFRREYRASSEQRSAEMDVMENSTYAIYGLPGVNWATFLEACAAQGLAFTPDAHANDFEIEYLNWLRERIEGPDSMWGKR